MPQHPQTELKLNTIGAALVVGTIALLMLGLQPILLGQLVEVGEISLEGVGLVAMGEIIALGLGVFIGDAVLPLSRIRFIAVSAAVLTAILDVVTSYASGDSQMIAVRGAAGLSEGILLWTTVSIIVRTSVPERISGLFFVIQTLSQAGLGALLAMAIIPNYGWQSGFLVLAVLSLLPCLLAVWHPARLAPFESKTSSGFAWSAATVAPLMIVFLQLCTIGSLWAYLEPLGKAAGFDAVSAQTVISGVLLMQVIGGMTATALVRFLPAVPALVSCALVLAGAVLYIYGLPQGHTMAFTIACAVFGFTWLFMLPFQISLAFRADPTGRVAVLVPSMQLLGSAIGPLTASLMVSGEDAGRVPIVSAAFALTAAMLVLLWSRHFAAALSRPIVPNVLD